MASISPATDSDGTRGGDTLIHASGIKKYYGVVHAVDGVDLEVRQGEIFGLIGHNGAGKSTLFKMMLGLIPPTAGQMLICGTATSSRAFRATRRQLGYLPENVVLYDNLSGLETLRFFAQLKHAPQAQCSTILERVGLAQAMQRPVRDYSKGMRQRLGFAQALLGTPRLLFLDEPTNGLDPQAIRDFYATLHTLRDQGVSIIITSHILAELQERVDRLAIMAGGKIQASGTVQHLREQMQMPLHLEIRCSAHVGQCAAQLTAHLPQVRWSAQDDSGSWQLSCPRADKMAALAALMTLGSDLTDLSVRESSLEDVFFGLSD